LICNIEQPNIVDVHCRPDRLRDQPIELRLKKKAAIHIVARYLIGQSITTESMSQDIYERCLDLIRSGSTVQLPPHYCKSWCVTNSP